MQNDSASEGKTNNSDKTLGRVNDSNDINREQNVATPDREADNRKFQNQDEENQDNKAC